MTLNANNQKSPIPIPKKLQAPGWLWAGATCNLSKIEVTENVRCNCGRRLHRKRQQDQPQSAPQQSHVLQATSHLIGTDQDQSQSDENDKTLVNDSDELEAHADSNIAAEIQRQKRIIAIVSAGREEQLQSNEQLLEYVDRSEAAVAGHGGFGMVSKFSIMNYELLQSISKQIASLGLLKERCTSCIAGDATDDETFEV